MEGFGTNGSAVNAVILSVKGDHMHRVFQNRNAHVSHVRELDAQSELCRLIDEIIFHANSADLDRYVASARDGPY